MTRFINAVLISVFAFFVFLAAFWQFGGDGSDRPSPGGAASVTGVEATWQAEGKPEMLIALEVHNPSSLESKVTAVSYKAEVEGKLVDSAIARPLSTPVVLDGKGDGEVKVPVDLPNGFVLSWWPTYMAEGEKADLRIQGVLTVKRDDGSRDVTFEWRSSWEGDLAEKLSSAVANCGADDSDLCLEDSRFFWKDGVLQAELHFLNPGSEPVAVRNTSISLLFGERAVVSGDVDIARTLAAGADAQVGLALPFAPAAMEAWWPDHLARCERTPVALRMDLQVELGEAAEGSSPEVVTLQWTFPASTFQTRFVCSP